MRKAYWMIVLFLIFILVLSGCGQPATSTTEQGGSTDLQAEVGSNDRVEGEAPATEIPPTDVPTSAPAPTEAPTSTPEPTPLPEGVLFRDDFNGDLQDGWTWLQEDPERYRFVEIDGEGWLEITGTNFGFGNGGQVLMRELPEGDFMITAHIVAAPATNFQSASIFIFEDPQNFVGTNIGFCDLERCGTGGHGFYMDAVIDNNPFSNNPFGGTNFSIPRQPDQTEVYLRIVSQYDTLRGYYATSYGDWQQIGAFGNFFGFSKIGLVASNSAPAEWEMEDIVAQFDYFEIALPDMP